MSLPGFILRKTYNSTNFDARPELPNLVVPKLGTHPLGRHEMDIGAGGGTRPSAIYGYFARKQYVINYTHI